MESAQFPMRFLRVTQGYGRNSINHKSKYPLDLGGEDTGIDNVYAPFTGTIKKIYANGNSVWLQSDDKVRFADGTIDFATVLFIHDNSIKNLNVGKKIKQWSDFYDEGTAGKAKGNHVHIEGAKGKFTGTGWTQQSDGTWRINNAIPLHKLFFVNSKKTKILNSGGYKWKELEMNLLTKRGILVLFRFYRGTVPTAAQIKKYVGKVTFDRMEDILMAGLTHKLLIRKAKAGTLNPVEFIPFAFRSNFKQPVQDQYEPIKQQLYIKK